MVSKVSRIVNKAKVILANMETSVQTQTERTFDNVTDYLEFLKPDIKLLTLDEYTYKMVYSPMQSGKSMMLICKAIEYANENMNVVLVVRDYKMDFMQIKRRILDTMSDIRVLIKNKTIKKNMRSIEILACKEVKKRDIEQGRNIIIMMANQSQYNRLDRLYKLEDLEQIAKTVILIDEIDANIKRQTSKLGLKLMSNEHWNVAQRIGVSATAAGLIFSDYQLESAQLIVLTPNEDYKGVEKLDIEEISENKEQMMNIYNAIARTEHRFESANGKAHPYIILNKTKREKEEQLKLGWELYDTYYEEMIEGKRNVNEWIHVIVNSDGVKIISDVVLYKVHKKNVTINGQVQVEYTKKLTNQEYEIDDGCYIIREDISAVLQILKVNLERTMTKRQIQKTVINIVGGQCLSRGISVVSRDYHWHLNSEYYVCGKATDCGTILQALRVCGIYKDNIPLKLWTTNNIRTHIRGYHTLQEKVMKVMKAQEDDFKVAYALDKIIVREQEMMLKRGLGRGRTGESVKVKYTTTNGQQVISLPDISYDEAQREINSMGLEFIKCGANDDEYIVRGDVTRVARK
jgi:thymidine kinase